MITSTANPLVAELTALHRSRGRKAAGRTLLEGPTLLAEAIGAGVRPDLVVTTDPDRWAGAGERVVAVSDRVLARVATTKTPQDPVAVVRPPHRPLAAANRLVAWGISDPGNLGTMIRTSAALGVDVVVGGADAVDPWAPKVIRAGAGAHFRTTIGEVDTIEEALSGRAGLALVVAGGEPPAADPGGRWALVVGSEAHGLPRDVVERCQPITLPMPGGTESLNAAVAASVAMYQLIWRDPPRVGGISVPE